MSVIKILQYPDPRLKIKGEKVEEVNAEIRKMVNDMFETHYQTQNCAALAATQLDFAHPKRITVIDYSPQHNQPLCLINPEIIAADGEQYDAEGCMSVPAGVYEKVKRANKITVRALNPEGRPIEFTAEGFLARCIQHELDHLDGKLFIDRISQLKRSRAEKKIQNYYRQHDK